jgi:hypothetical protein
MKFKLSVLLILLATAGLIALLDFIINRVDPIHVVKDSSAPENKDESKAASKNKSPNNQAQNNRQLANDYEDGEDEDDEDEEGNFGTDHHAQKSEITSQDREKINSIVKLSDDELVAQIQKAESQLEKDDLIDKLEEDNLSPSEKAKAINLLEHFSMLNFERARRKKMDKDPKYKNALSAHEKGLMEIRELLAD